MPWLRNFKESSRFFSSFQDFSKLERKPALRPNWLKRDQIKKKILPIPANRIRRHLDCYDENLLWDKLSERGCANLYPGEPMLCLPRQKNGKALNIKTGKTIGINTRMQGQNVISSTS